MDKILVTITVKIFSECRFAYKKETNCITGIEATYGYNQRLSDGTIGKSYTIVGILKKNMKHLKVSINTENLTDSRQIR